MFKVLFAKMWVGNRGIAQDIIEARASSSRAITTPKSKKVGRGLLYSGRRVYNTGHLDRRHDLSGKESTPRLHPFLSFSLSWCSLLAKPNQKPEGRYGAALGAQTRAERGSGGESKGYPATGLGKAFPSREELFGKARRCRRACKSGKCTLIGCKEGKQGERCTSSKASHAFLRS